MLRGSVFGQFLALGEAKQQDTAVGGAEHSAADNPVRRKSALIGQRHDLRRGALTNRFLVHVVTLNQLRLGGFDGSQGFRKFLPYQPW